MSVFAGIASLASFSLFLAHVLRRSSSWTPLLSCAVAMCFFSLFGVLGFLTIGGYVWYILSAAAFIYTVFRTKKDFFRLFSVGFTFFVLGSVLFLIYCIFTNPMLTHWDEFTFWGTAAKVTVQNDELYTTARSSLIARSYQPGIIVFAYMLQFFGSFSDASYIAGYMVLYLACMAVPAALWHKSKSTSVLMLLSLFFIPLFFPLTTSAGQMQWTYFVCMADLPLAMVFGGTLCFYLTQKDKTLSTFLSFFVLIAALTLIKDMGFAFALIALAVACLDLFFCHRQQLSIGRLQKSWVVLAFFILGTVIIFAIYLLWSWHFSLATATDRLNFGSQGSTLSPVGLLITGTQMLFGINRSDQFSVVLEKMMSALFTHPVSVVGSGMVVLCIILLISVLAFVFSPTRRQQRKVVVFTLGMSLFFAAFYIFNIFTYGLIFQPQEALVLKDYTRYISPFWIAWLMGALTILASSATHPKASFYRSRTAQVVCSLVSICLILTVAIPFNWQANFLRVSASQYTERLSVQSTVDAAVSQGAMPEDTVYIVSQGDDGSRFYMFGYELAAVRSLLYGGYLTDMSGTVITDDEGTPILHGNATSALAAEGISTSPEDFARFLKQENVTHILIDSVDEYFLSDFSFMFSDNLNGWSATDPDAVGHCYYSVQWDGEMCEFVPQESTNSSGGAS